MRWRRGSDLSAAHLWTTTIRGDAAHNITLVRETASVYLGDGWGVPYSSAHIRRHDLRTGAEVARFRSYNGLRCCTLLTSGYLLAAVDTKLFELDAHSLEEQRRWDRRIPRYPDSMAAVDRSVVLANWLRPSIGVVDLNTGRVRRRNAPPMTKVLPRGDEPVLVGGSITGGTCTVSMPAAGVKPLRETPPAIDAELSPDLDVLWLLVGVRTKVTPSETAPGRPSTELRSYPLDGEGYRAYRLPAPASRITVGEGVILLAEEERVTRAEMSGEHLSFATWHVPPPHRVAAMDPVSGFIITVELAPGSGTSTMSCWLIDPTVPKDASGG